MRIEKATLYTPNYTNRQTAAISPKFNNSCDTVSFSGKKEKKGFADSPLLTAFLEMMYLPCEDEDFETLAPELKKDDHIKDAMWEADYMLEELDMKTGKLIRDGKKLLKAGKKNNYKGYTQYGKKYKVSYGGINKETGMPTAITIRDTNDVYKVYRHYKLTDGFKDFEVRDFVGEDKLNTTFIENKKVVEYMEKDYSNNFTTDILRKDEDFWYTEGTTNENDEFTDTKLHLSYVNDAPGIYSEKNEDGEDEKYIYSDSDSMWVKA